MTSNHLDCTASPGRHNEEDHMLRMEDDGEHIEMTPTVSVADKHNNHPHLNDYHVYYNTGIYPKFNIDPMHHTVRQGN